MKTAKQWSDEWQRKDFHRSLEQQFEAAQLDAFKAGAEWAARVCDGHADWLPADNEECKDAILAAVKNLTEIPK